MADHRAPPSLGFSRQEHWSGLPLPSPMHESEKWKWSRSVMSNPQRPHGLQPSRLLHPWDFPGKSTGVGCQIPTQMLLFSSKIDPDNHRHHSATYCLSHLSAPQESSSSCLLNFKDNFQKTYLVTIKLSLCIQALSHIHSQEYGTSPISM